MAACRERTLYTFGLHDPATKKGKYFNIRITEFLLIILEEKKN